MGTDRTVIPPGDSVLRSMGWKEEDYKTRDISASFAPVHPRRAGNKPLRSRGWKRTKGVVHSL